MKFSVDPWRKHTHTHTRMHAAYTHTPEIVIFFSPLPDLKWKQAGRVLRERNYIHRFFSPELTAEKDYEELWCGYLFIGLSINGHLDFFYILASVNNTAWIWDGVSDLSVNLGLHNSCKPKEKKVNCSVLFQRRQWQPTPVLLPGKSYGRRSLVGCSPWGR